MADESFPEAYARECARVRKVLSEYEEVRRMPGGEGCAFAIAMIKQTLAEAERAATAGDLVAMLRAYRDMEGTL